MSNYFLCPHCGAEVKKGAESCQECGSDKDTGWSEFTYIDGLGLPDSDDYEEIKSQEFSEKQLFNKTWITITTVIILAGIIFLIINNIF